MKRGRLLVVVDALVANADRLSVTLDCLSRQRASHNLFSIRILASTRSPLAAFEYLERLSEIAAYKTLDISLVRTGRSQPVWTSRLAAFDGDSDYVLFLNQGDQVSGDFIGKSCLMLDTDPGVSWIDPLHIDELPIQPRRAQAHSVASFLISRKYTSGYVYRTSDVKNLGDLSGGVLGRNPFFDFLLQISLLGAGRFSIRTDTISCIYDQRALSPSRLRLKEYLAALALALRAGGVRTLLLWRGMASKRRHVALGSGQRRLLRPGWLSENITRRIFQRFGQADRFVSGDFRLFWTLLIEPSKFEKRLEAVEQAISIAELRAGFVRKPVVPLVESSEGARLTDAIVFAHTNWTIGGAERVLQTWMKYARLATKGRLVEAVEREAWNIDRIDKDFVLTDSATKAEFAALSDDQYSLEALGLSARARLNMFIEIVTRERPRILFISGNAFAYAALPALKRLYPEMIIADILHNEWNSFFDWFNIAAEYDRYLDRRIVISEHWRQVLVDKYHVAFEKIALIPNGISIEKFQPDVDRRKARRKAMGFVNGERVVCFIGRLHYQKNPEVFFRLLDLFQDRKNYRFVVAGDGPERKRLLDTYGDRDNLTYLGAIEDVAGLLDVADLAIYCSAFEGYPIASLEAAAMDVPIIAPDIVGFREQLALGRFGQSYSPSGDITTDALTIARLIDTGWNDLLEQGSNGRPFVATYHDIVKVGVQQAELFGEMLAPPRRRAISARRKQVYLHVGMPKTGTSSVQWFFDQNRDLLRTKGVLYPAELTASYAHHPAAWYCLPLGAKPSRDALSIYESPEELRRAADQFRQTIRDSAYEEIVVSSESFWRSQQSRVAELFAGFDVRIVATLRRQDSFFEASYNQNSKIYGRRIAEETHRRSMLKLNYERELSKWAEHFGAENITIIPFEPRWFPNGLERKFADVVGFTWDNRFRVDVRNSRMNRDCLDFLICLNGLGMLPRQRYLDVVYLCEEYSETRPDPAWYRNVFSPQMRSELLEQFAESNARVAAQYLPPGEPLFDTRIADDGIWRPYPGVSRDKAEDIARFLIERGIEKQVLRTAIEAIPRLN